MQETVPTLKAPGIVLRQCAALEEFDRCVDLQREIWRYADVDVVPSAILVVAAKTGGHVIGAFDGQTMVGFALGFAAWHAGETYIHSHMAGVLPAYHSRGIGRQLKLMQREICLQSNIRLIEWTFDPLELKNAHFNIVRLGAVMRRILPNLYGVTTSQLHGVLPTDRLVAEWAIGTTRVASLLEGRPEPARKIQTRVTLPLNIGDLKQNDTEAAKRVQARAREEFERCFAIGYAVTGFEMASTHASYLLEPYED